MYLVKVQIINYAYFMRNGEQNKAVWAVAKVVYRAFFVMHDNSTISFA